MIKLSTIASVVGTLCLALFTGWMAWETQSLKMVDIGPNISISDVALELVDINGSPREVLSWREGKLKDLPGGVLLELIHLSVKVKFLNTGKDSGYIQLLKLGDISIDNFEEKKLLVPAQGETGWIYIRDIIKDINPSADSQFIDINYIYKAYDSDLSPRKEEKESIRCSFSTDPEMGTSYSCEPISLIGSEENNIFKNLSTKLAPILFPILVITLLIWLVLKLFKNLNTRLIWFTLILLVIVAIIFVFIFSFVSGFQVSEKTTVAATLFASFIALIFGFLALIKDAIFNFVFRPELKVERKESSASEPYTITYVDEHELVSRSIRCAKSFGLRVENKSFSPVKNIRAKIREKKKKEVNWLDLETRDDVFKGVSIRNLSRHEDEWFRLGYKSKDVEGGDFYLAVAPRPYASRNNQSIRISNSGVREYDLVIVAENTKPQFFNIKINNSDDEKHFNESNIELIPCSK